MAELLFVCRWFGLFLEGLGAGDPVVEVMIAAAVITVLFGNATKKTTGEKKAIERCDAEEIGTKQRNLWKTVAFESGRRISEKSR
jgi:hypothetical protein